MMLNRRDQFPVLPAANHRDNQFHQSLECPLFVPWPFVAEHEKQCLKNHSQSPHRLAERGGLSPAEMVAVVEDRQWHDMALPVAITTLKAHLEAWYKKTSYGQTCALDGCTLPATAGPGNWLPSRCERHALDEADERSTLLPEEHARRLLECVRYIRTNEETREALDAGAVQIRALAQERKAIYTAIAGAYGSPASEPLTEIAVRLADDVEAYRVGLSAGFGILTANPHKTLVELASAQRDHHRKHHLREREAWEAVKSLTEAVLGSFGPVVREGTEGDAWKEAKALRERAIAALSTLDEQGLP